MIFVSPQHFRLMKNNNTPCFNAGEEVSWSLDENTLTIDWQAVFSWDQSNQKYFEVGGIFSDVTILYCFRCTKGMHTVKSHDCPYICHKILLLEAANFEPCAPDVKVWVKDK